MPQSRKSLARQRDAAASPPYDRDMPRQRVRLTPELTRFLRSRRTDMRLSQAQAAVLAGVSPTWWRRIEGGNKPRGDAEVQTVVKMLAALGVRPDELSAINEKTLANALSHTSRGEVDDKQTLRALVEGLSSEEASAVVAFISTLRRVSDDRRRIKDRGA